ncbi:ParA family protein [Pseudoxanthomonas sp. CF125]|jgi:chromosome partitioning protein|uniref:ParA family protein n=1 Tax=Pseudoxanthomonas sp. CF125 TaxID=1855303 RepID=UPI0008918E66|nr:ParA family protein [Pseudoxanthomonas sp. CF125]SDR15636.1 chromosome partitioning protein [Pseudoxanthomonas sp. CF125]
MKTILVASSKGGAGKSTLATNLAAHFALDGKRTVLVDADPQHSSTRWAERRSELETAVLPIDASGKRPWRSWLPEDAERVVIDAPAGSMADDLQQFIEHADAIVVPVLPSAMDIEATVGFLNSLSKVPRVHKRKLPVGLVVNRSKPWTNTSQQAVEMLKTWPYPVVAQLRDTQAYVVLAGLGRSLFDYRSAQVRDHQADWDPLLKWVKKA